MFARREKKIERFWAGKDGGQELPLWLEEQTTIKRLAAFSHSFREEACVPHRLLMGNCFRLRPVISVLRPAAAHRLREGTEAAARRCRLSLGLYSVFEQVISCKEQ